ncbi:tyrosine-type recombinase/integrase [Luteibacter sp. 9133]|uniref:tyrosine-type recombinase/integrase n=1 Tax=Luteibacter sp. 9133 TaxID=1500891 RepID=UPI0005B77D37|nr:tyrosine-type recombinase/integrase [Luteibacter sp. 9133]
MPLHAPQSASEPRRAVLGSLTEDLSVLHHSDRLDLRRALHPGEVPELLAHLAKLPVAKTWHRFAPLLALYGGLTPPQIARLRTDDLTFVHGHGWLSVPRAERAASDAPPLMIPLHAELVKARFPGVAHSRYFTEAEETWVFPDLAKAARPGDAAESWLRRALRPLSRVGQHAPTFRDLRATAAYAALEGGAPVRMVEAWMGLDVPLWDDRGATDADGRRRVQDEWIWEAVEAVAYPPRPGAGTHATALPASWRPLLDSAAPIVASRIDAATSCGGAS